MPEADYDYVAGIEAVSLPAGVVMVLDDADGILGTHGEPNTMNQTFDAAGDKDLLSLLKNFSKFNYVCAPGQAAAKSDQQDNIALLNATAPDAFVQRNGYRGR